LNKGDIISWLKKPGEQLYWILFFALIFTYLTERLKLEQAEKSLNDLKHLRANGADTF